MLGRWDLPTEHLGAIVCVIDMMGMRSCREQSGVTALTLRFTDCSLPLRIPGIKIISTVQDSEAVSPVVPPKMPVSDIMEAM